MHCFISELETPQLVAVYANVTGKTVKKFESRKAAIKRVGAALAKKYDTEFASNGTCVYAPAGMEFDLDACDFVEKGGGAVVTVEDRAEAVEKESEVAERVEKDDAARKDVGLNVKTSGNPVRKEGGSPAKGRRLGIGKRMEQLLAAGVLPKEIVATIHEEFPASRATTKDVYLIRSRMNEAA